MPRSVRGPLEVVEAVPTAILQSTFLEAMGSVAAAVAVVTTLVDGEPHGATVSAFVSLSLNPPMLLVSLKDTSRLLSVLEPGASVGVNVLADHQHDVALRFAQRRNDKFRDLEWTVQDEAPALADRHAWVAMRVAQLIPAGDHTLVLGDVHAAGPGERDPLTYWRRTFGTHRAL